MNTDQLQATLERNKPVVLGGGLAAVVGLALYRKHKGGSSTTDAGAALSSGSQTAAASGGAAYDSSASDLYGAIQPQLEAIGQQLSQLQNGPSSIPAPTPPKPSPVIANDTNLRWVPGRKTFRPANVIPSPAPRRMAAAAPAAAPSPVKYTVRPGDNLTKIAQRYPSAKITSGSIYAANKGTIGSNPNLIRPGQQLVIR